MINVSAYAQGDGQARADGAMTAGSATLTSATASFGSVAGKWISVVGAGPAGGTLITTISAVNSSTSVTLAVAASTTVTGALIFWGTDDTTAINTAIGVASAQNPGGDILLFDEKRYIVRGSLDLSAAQGVTLQGVGTLTGGASPGTQIALLNSGTTTLISGGAPGNAIKGIQLYCVAPEWSGTLVKPAAGGRTRSWSFDSCQFECEGFASGSVLVDLTDCNLVSFRNCLFTKGGVQLKGGNDANSVYVGHCNFTDVGTVSIKDPQQGWELNQSNFENGHNNQAAAVLCTSDAIALSIQGCWFGDAQSTASGQAWLTLRGTGIHISGNYIAADLTLARNVTGIKFTSNCWGVSISGNRFEFTTASNSGCVAIDFGSWTMESLDCTTNYISATTHFANTGGIGVGEGLRSMTGARAWPSSSQAIPSGTLTNVTLQTATAASSTSAFNRGTWTNVSGVTKFTVPTGGAGIWMVQGQVAWPSGSSAGTFRATLIRKNGSFYIARAEAPPASIALIQNISCIDLAVETDSYELVAFHDAGAAVSLLASDSGMTFACAVKLS